MAKNRTWILVLTALIVIVVSLGMFKVAGTRNKVQKQAEALTETPAVSDSPTIGIDEPAPARPAPKTAKVTLESPSEGASLSVSRLIKGTAENTGGKISYTVYGDQSGLVARGTISFADDTGSAKEFTSTISFTKKPVSGDGGVLKIMVTENGAETEALSVRVVF